MYRIYKTEYYRKRPRWIVPLLLEISPKDFVQPTIDLARKQLDGIVLKINGFSILGKRHYKVEQGEDYVSIINESGIPFLSYRIESFNNQKNK